MTHSNDSSTYTVRLEAFEGPLDLLLQLVEAERLSLTEIRLAEVTDAFLQEVRRRAENEAYPLEALAHFLVVASKLVALKARLLVPSITESGEEEESLLVRLRAYQAYVRAGGWLRGRVSGGSLLFARGSHEEPKDDILPRVPTLEKLKQVYLSVLKRAEAPPAPPRPVLLERLVTLEDRMSSLRERLRSGEVLSLFRWVGEEASREMRLVSFLAVLELVRLRSVEAEQTELFSDVRLSSL